MTRLHPLTAFAACLSMLAAVGCDSVPLTSPTGSTITMTSDRSVLPLNGVATLHAVVIESAGTPVQNGTTVTFSSTLGTVDPVEAKTVNGVATATFNAGSVSGKSSINAFSGGAKTTAATEITIGSAAAKSIALSATPSSVSQSGGTATIAALVMDEAGNTLPGVSVTFSADVGQLASATALSDSAGIARTQLTTNQTSKVTATAGTATKDITVTVSTAPTVTIEAPSPASPVAGQPVTFTVTTTSGTSTAPRQVQTLEVNFGDGTTDIRSNVTGSTAFTHTYNREGGYTITARAVDVGGNTGVASRGIVVGFAPQPTVSVSSNKNPVSMGAPDNGVVILTISASAPTGGTPIRDVRLTGQDGTVIYQNSGPVSSTQVPYRFDAPGTYTFRVTATDATGQTSTASTVVFVQ